MQAPSVHARQIAAAVPQPPGVRACARPLAVELAPARNHVLRPLEPVLILQGRAMGSTVVRKVKGVGRGHQGCGREPGRHSSLSPHGVLQGGPARAARACHHHMGHTPPGAMQTCSSVSSVWRRSSMLVCWSNLRGEGAGRGGGGWGCGVWAVLVVIGLEGRGGGAMAWRAGARGQQMRGADGRAGLRCAAAQGPGRAQHGWLFRGPHLPASMTSLAISILVLWISLRTRLSMESAYSTCPAAAAAWAAGLVGAADAPRAASAAGQEWGRRVRAELHGRRRRSQEAWAQRAAGEHPPPAQADTAGMHVPTAAAQLPAPPGCCPQSWPQHSPATASRWMTRTSLVCPMRWELHRGRDGRAGRVTRRDDTRSRMWRRVEHGVSCLPGSKKKGSTAAGQCCPARQLWRPGSGLSGAPKLLPHRAMACSSFLGLGSGS